MMPMPTEPTMPGMTPEAPPAQKPNPTVGTDMLPLEVLAIPDENEEMVDPQPGDRVTYTVEGRILTVNGSMATVKRESINGQAVEGQGEQPEAPDEMGELENEAEKTGPLY